MHNETKTWVSFRRRYIPAAMPLVNYWSWNAKEYFGNVDFGTHVQFWQDGWFVVSQSAKDLPFIADFFFQRMMKKGADLLELRERGNAAGKIMVQVVKDFDAIADDASYEAYADALERMNTAVNDHVCQNLVYWFFASDSIQKTIGEELGGLDEQSRQTVIQALSKPTEPSYSEMEERRFYEVVATAKEHGIDSKKTAEAIADFSRAYSWFPYEYVGPDIWDPETTKKMVEKALQEGVVHKEATYLTEQEVKAYEEQYKLSQKAIRAFEVWRAATLMQDDRKRYGTELCYYVNGQILKKLAAKLGIPLDLVRYIDRDVLMAYIQTNDIAALKKELEDRSKAMVFFWHDGQYRAFSGEKAIQEIERNGLDEVITKEVSEIIGTVANRGFARGKAQVLARSSGAVDFGTGDILVTGMTTPDFLPLLKKAGAIVTDEGGITCHAAIVSRELNIPCVIGTHTATRVIKTGDEIEVDAEKGMVRIVKRAG